MDSFRTVTSTQTQGAHSRQASSPTWGRAARLVAICSVSVVATKQQAKPASRLVERCSRGGHRVDAVKRVRRSCDAGDCERATVCRLQLCGCDCHSADSRRGRRAAVGPAASRLPAGSPPEAHDGVCEGRALVWRRPNVHCCCAEQVGPRPGRGHCDPADHGGVGWRPACGKAQQWEAVTCAGNADKGGRMLLLQDSVKQETHGAGYISASTYCPSDAYEL